MPSPKQMEKLARERPVEAPESEPDGWWQSVLNDPRAAGTPRLPVQQLRLNEIPREILSVDYIRCGRAVEITKADDVRLYGPHAVWKHVGERLLDNTCPQSPFGYL
jgi:hypothetical protein